MKDIEKRGLNTKLIHAGQHIDPATGAVATPIYQSSTFAFRDADHGAACFGGEPGYKYTRLGNPTTEALEKNIAEMEGGCGGLGAASGMAAVNMVYLTFLGVDTHIVATESLYGPSRMILENEYPRFGVSSSFVDSTNPENVAAAMRDNTKLVYVETPANPTLKMTDIAACAEIAHDRGALLCVDNTFASPYLQNPLGEGADIVLHSMTKFINGHTDVVAGMVVAKDPDVLARLRAVHYNIGGTHPQYELGKRQMRGPGAVFSFGVKGGLEAGKTLINNVEVPALAVSLGGIESLIEHPASMTHAGIPVEERLQAEITDDLVRIAVGCETYEDLESDMARVLDMI
ncbi:methionine gamma-lyase [bacterium DOLJORAL78_65_58]|nr:MAG: methionine gamma-lyase [bacterium DOLJORAL78_65_58]